MEVRSQFYYNRRISGDRERQEGITHQCFTLFVDNIPEKEDKSWLVNIFTNYGVVKDAYIPVKRSKRGSKFGFIKYDCPVAMDMTIYRANGMYLGNQRLLVKEARFGQMYHSNERWRNRGVVEASKQGECRSHETLANKVRQDMSFAQVVKGKETPGDQNRLDCIHVQPAGNGWLYRSAIGKMRQLFSVDEMKHIFKKENIKNVQIKAIGGRFLILTFPNEDVRNEIIKAGELTGWFEELSKWDGEQAKDERFVWLACYGMPLNAWSVPTFKEIGQKWGHFIEVDENTLKEVSYERGRILIAA